MQSAGEQNQLFILWPVMAFQERSAPESDAGHITLQKHFVRNFCQASVSIHEMFMSTPRASSRRLYKPRQRNVSAAHKSALHHSQLASSLPDKSIRVMEDRFILSSEPAVEIVRA
jgi:hypothetical protein